MWRALIQAAASRLKHFDVNRVFGKELADADLEVSRLPSRPELPDPLVMLNGERVASKEQWLSKRRPELQELFQYYMYGYLPAAPVKIEYEVEREDGQSLDGKATLKEVIVSFGPPEVPRIHLLLAVPNKRPGPAPVFLGANACGFHVHGGTPGSPGRRYREPR